MAHFGHPAAAIRAHEEVFSYWSSLRGGAPAPARGQLDPRGLTRHLPTVSLTEVLPGEAIDYRIRLAGTALYSVYGREITGRRLGEVYNEGAEDYWREELGRIVKDRKPAVGVHNMAWRGASHMTLVWLRLPLSTRGCGEVDMILGYDSVLGMGPVASGIRTA